MQQRLIIKDKENERYFVYDKDKKFMGGICKAKDFQKFFCQGCSKNVSKREYGAMIKDEIFGEIELCKKCMGV